MGSAMNGNLSSTTCCVTGKDRDFRGPGCQCPWRSGWISWRSQAFPAGFHDDFMGCHGTHGTQNSMLDLIVFYGKLIKCYGNFCWASIGSYMGSIDFTD